MDRKEHKKRKEESKRHKTDTPKAFALFAGFEPFVFLPFASGFVIY